MDGLNTFVTENEDNSLNIHFSTAFTNYITEVAGKTGWNMSNGFLFHLVTNMVTAAEFSNELKSEPGIDLTYLPSNAKFYIEMDGLVIREFSSVNDARDWYKNEYNADHPPVSYLEPPTNYKEKS